MSSLFPLLTETGRRWWLGTALIVGAVGIAVAVMRRDWFAVGVITLALVLLIAVWWWGRGKGGEDEGGGEE
jgi:hypothetical protein